MLARRDLLKLAGCGVAASAVSAPGGAEARGPAPMSPDAIGLLFDGTLCIGCRACIHACKDANGMPPERTELLGGALWDAPLDLSGRTLNVIKAYKDGSGAHKDEIEDGFAFTKSSCMHCVDASCVSVCPVSAMTKDPVTGVVHYNLEACIGCRYCVAACPFGVPRFTYDAPSPKIAKCQLCAPRLAAGKLPACAEVCPTGATLFGKVSDLKAEVQRRRSLEPGTRTSYPRGKLGGGDGADVYVGAASRYVDHVYGEHEIGGTQVLHLSGVPFELLNKPRLPDVAPARISETLQQGIYHGFVAPLAFLVGLVALAFRNMRGKDETSPDRGTSERGRGGAP